MPSKIAIVHGWSDSSRSFYDLRDFLTSNGWQTVDIRLTDYISTDDDVRVEDVAKRMNGVIEAALADGTLSRPFDMIVHSTGGLVAREWLARFYPDGRSLSAGKAKCPLKRLIMLAPANFGSRLASLGKSMIGRLAKGWNNWLQSGTEMLTSLELASAYQWNLATRDLFDRAGDGMSIYGHGKVWPFVIVGSRPYPKGVQQIVNEDGSDGTVRAAAANLNAVGITVDFSTGSENPTVTPWLKRAGDTVFPFAVLPDRDHGSIHKPRQPTGATQELSNALGELILQALNCNTDAQYAKMARDWVDRSAATEGLSEDPAKLAAAFTEMAATPENLHQYMQMVTLVRDDSGQLVDDYFLEFFSPEKAGNADFLYFHRKVIEHVHVNGASASRRCLFVDHTDLMTGFYKPTWTDEQKQVAVSISATAPGRNIRYFDSTKEGAKGHLIVHTYDQEKRAELPARLFRNSTHLVEIVIPRQAIDKVFKLS